MNLPTMWETQVQSLGQEDPWRRKCQPMPIFLPGKFHGQSSMEGYNPEGHKESYTAERLTLLVSASKTEKISFCCLSHQVYGTWLQQPQETDTSGSGHPPGCQSCGCLGRWVPLPLTRKTQTALPCNPTTTLAAFSYSCSLSFCSQSFSVLFQGFWHKPMHGALGQKPSPLIPPQRTIQTS